jgi:hypothetical protein
MATYGLDEHRHRFSSWAAARAAQRGSTDVATLVDALAACGVVNFVRTCDLNSVDVEAFDRLHGSWCRSIVRHLKSRGAKGATFGRAAKLIAIYLKCTVVLGPGWRTKLAHVAHPPIDRILLSHLPSVVGESCDHKHRWASFTWTKLSQKRYARLIRDLRQCICGSEPFWKIEQFWPAPRGTGHRYALQWTRSRAGSLAERGKRCTKQSRRNTRALDAEE